jgi:hypothetical protein
MVNRPSIPNYGQDRLKTLSADSRADLVGVNPSLWFMLAAGDPVEQERHQNDPPPRPPWETWPETQSYSVHRCPEGTPFARAGFSRPATDFTRCTMAWSVARRVDILTAQSVVRPGLDHHDARRVTEQPLEPTERTGGRLPAESGIHDAQPDSGRIDFALKHGGIRTLGIEAESGGQRRSHDQQRWSTISRTGRRSH